jgi:putative aminopeptidase
MKLPVRVAVIVVGLLLWTVTVDGQAAQNALAVRRTPTVTGHEKTASDELVKALQQFHPIADNLGNVIVTVGTGAPHRLIATTIDEPGYVVSEITADGYLRVQRLPQAAPNAVFDALNFAQPVHVITRDGKYVNGVFAGLSVHLQPGRLNSPKMNYVEELYVDIGAKNAEEVRAAGVDVLDPIALWRTRGPETEFGQDFVVGNSGPAGPATAENIGQKTLLGLLAKIRESKAAGTTTIAFVTQQWLGGRGLNRLLTEIHPDEMLFVGRITPVPTTEAGASLDEAKPGSGVILGLPSEVIAGEHSLSGELKALAAKEQIQVHTITAVPPRMASYAKNATLPTRFAVVGVPLLWPVSPAETAAWKDVDGLQRLLEAYLSIGKGGVAGVIEESRGGISDIKVLTESYGTSKHEAAVRETVKKLLPEWARNKATTDAAGNLVLHLGDGSKDAKTPRLAFVAHMDEIGYEVKKIEDDGRLQVEVLGGGYPQFFLGHVVLVHKKDGNHVGGVLELPSGWDKPGYEFPMSSRSMDEPAHVYVGTHTSTETEKLGITVGDFVTIPKEYRPLVGTRANARSFDDRMGCAALIAAIRAIGPDLPGRDVTFVWSTEEELGLNGAAAFAEQAAKEGRTPDFVFAIDTFVSSDSPLETRRFADAELGKGFVVRAVDNSNIVPLQYVDHVVALAKENNIPVQYGVTGGGNDGSVFPRYGSVDVALGWALRYAHSPAEVIDTKDLEALGRIVEVIARKW